MLKQNRQINKMGTKKKITKEVVYECLSCSRKIIGPVMSRNLLEELSCPCGRPQYVINTRYKVGEYNG